MFAIRRAAMLVFLLVVLACVAAPAARTQPSPELIELNAQTGRLYREGKFAEAMPIARRALALAERQLGPANPDICTSLDYLALLHRRQRQHGEAEALLKRSIGISEKALGVEHKNVAISLNTLAEVYQEQGRYGEAEPLFKRALRIREKVHGLDHPYVATTLNGLAALYREQGRYGEAEPLFKRTLGIREKALGAEHAQVGVTLDHLALLYVAQGRYGEAEPLHERAVAIFEKSQGPDGPDLSAALENQALLYLAQGRYGEAEPLLRRALGINERSSGPDHPSVADTLNNLIGVYQAQGRYSEAEPLLLRALGINERSSGPDHPSVADTLNNLTGIYQALGRYSEAELTMLRSLKIRERTLDVGHPQVGTSLANLASLYVIQSRYGEAEPLLRRALAIHEKALGPTDLNVANSLEALALLYLNQRRFAEALLLLTRALDIREKTLGRDHPSVGDTLHNLGLVYPELGRHNSAAQVLKQALAIAERRLGPDHHQLGDTLNLLAGLSMTLGRLDEAEGSSRRALEIAEKALGPESLPVGAALTTLAQIRVAQERHGEAEPLLRRALAIREKLLGADHPTVSNALNNLAMLAAAQRQWRAAAAYLRRSTDVIIRRAGTGAPAADQAPGAPTKSEAVRQSWKFWGLVKMAHRIAAEEPSAAAHLGSEMFEIAQWASASDAAAALRQMAARVATGNTALTAQVRERQDLVTERQKRDLAVIDAVIQRPENRDLAAEVANAARLTAVESRIAAIDKHLAVQFPDYAALARSHPLSVAQVRSELAPNEALVLFLDTPEMTTVPEETFVWVVTRSELRWVRSGLGTPGLTREVAALRCGLDAAAWRNDGEAACQGLLGSAFRAADYDAGRPLPFEPTRAHALYKGLLGDVAETLKGKHLLIVPSGALTKLPFQVLVTRPTGDNNLESAAWLIRDHAITVLPSVASLAALRRTAKPSAAPLPMIAFGNPLLDGNQSHPKYGAFYREQAQIAHARSGCAAMLGQTTASRRTLSRSAAPLPPSGGLADLAELRLQSPLPETADELCAVARSVGADVGEVRLGTRATETEIKSLSARGDLAKYRIVHFATHGLLAGDLTGTREPGLILSPPNAATSEDDGYLSGSEIAALKLDAQWVILSACNTAGGAGAFESAEALSGLARMFFYAGARALLVSHWEVDSSATVTLITSAVNELTREKGLGRSEALRRSMLAVMADRSRPAGWVSASHPSIWAPFVVVGEGGAGR